MNVEEIKQLHKEILWPTVRIRAVGAWGSGTIIYSEPDVEGKCRTYIISCYHVVEGNIKVEKKWDPSVGMEVKKEIRSPVEVELFYYEPPKFSHAKGIAGSYRADIVAYDADQDVVLLELDRVKRLDEAFLCWLFPREKIEGEIHIFDEVYAVGAAMGHEPIATKGTITFMDEVIDNYEYWMSTAQIIFGNSGGAVFRFSNERERYEFIGVPARVAVSIQGFSTSPITHMGFFVPISRIYKVLEKNHYEFIFDSSKTYEQCRAEREKADAVARKLFMAKFGEVDEREEPAEKSEYNLGTKPDYYQQIGELEKITVKDETLLKNI